MSGNGICRNQHAKQEAREAEEGNVNRKAVGLGPVPHRILDVYLHFVFITTAFLLALGIETFFQALGIV